MPKDRTDAEREWDRHKADDLSWRVYTPLSPETLRAARRQMEGDFGWRVEDVLEDEQTKATRRYAADDLSWRAYTPLSEATRQVMLREMGPEPSSPKDAE